MGRAVAAIGKHHGAAGQHITGRETRLERRKAELLEGLHRLHQRRGDAQQGLGRIHCRIDVLQAAGRNGGRGRRRFADGGKLHRQDIDAHADDHITQLVPGGGFDQNAAQLALAFGRG